MLPCPPVDNDFESRVMIVEEFESFAVFFQPAGWSMLFKTPGCARTNRFIDATVSANDFPGLRTP